MASFDQLDQEWVKLIQEAKDLGLSIQELKEYFQNNRTSLFQKEESLHSIQPLPS